MLPDPVFHPSQKLRHKTKPKIWGTENSWAVNRLQTSYNHRWEYSKPISSVHTISLLQYLYSNPECYLLSVYARCWFRINCTVTLYGIRSPSLRLARSLHSPPPTPSPFVGASSIISAITIDSHWRWLRPMNTNHFPVNPQSLRKWFDMFGAVVYAVSYKDILSLFFPNFFSTIFSPILVQKYEQPCLDFVDFGCQELMKWFNPCVSGEDLVSYWRGIYVRFCTWLASYEK